MKTRLRLPLLLLAVVIALTVPALADSGPKPLLTVNVLHPPEGLYYLDLLEEGEPPSQGDNLPQTRWENGQEVPVTYDQELLQALRGAAPEGWHACLAEGTGAPLWGSLTPEDDLSGGGKNVHTFGYFGLPDTCRIVIADKAGETWVSDPITRHTLQSSVTVDFKAKTVSEPPAWRAYALELLATLIPTLVIEGGILSAFGYHWKKSWKPFLLVNLGTQAGLYVFFCIPVVKNGFSYWYIFSYVLIETIILCTETCLYRRLLTEQSRRRAGAYAVAANLCSALAGWFLAEPVWAWISALT
jgi:hypothetical protein